MVEDPEFDPFGNVKMIDEATHHDTYVWPRYNLESYVRP